MNFDLTMPTTLFFVILVSMFLSKKIEGKLKGVFEDKEFRVRDAVLLVASIGVTISVVIWLPELALMALFLFAYSMVLFMFTYIFSNINKAKASLFCSVFLFVSLIAGLISQFDLVTNGSGQLGALVFYCLALLTIVAILYERKRKTIGERWYIAALPPTLFICLYVFFGRTPIWFPYLLNLYGGVFAVLIILYIGSLFTWKTTLVFTTLLTLADIILVLVTGSMVSAAKSVSGLKLPVLISLPITPLIVTEKGIQYMSLGLGDFFFAGLLAAQTRKRFGNKLGILSIIAMTVSFAIFEAYLLYFDVAAFPGTLMIISGWLPVVLVKSLKKMLVG